MWPTFPRGKEITHRMFVSLILAAVSVKYLANAQTQGIGQSVVACLNATDFVGYESLEALNTDMSAESQKIKDGEPPQPPYVFELCPNTNFDVTAGPLIPLLSGSVFMCGSGTSPGENCEFVGGTTQVLIEEPIDTPDYQLSLVSFAGISFSGFDESAISGGAGFNTTVDFTNVLFTVSSLTNYILKRCMHLYISYWLSLSSQRTSMQCSCLTSNIQQDKSLLPFKLLIVSSPVASVELHFLTSEVN